MGPPRLCTLAASALHHKLMADLDRVEAGLPQQQAIELQVELAAATTPPCAATTPAGGAAHAWLSSSRGCAQASAWRRRLQASRLWWRRLLACGMPPSQHGAMQLDALNSSKHSCSPSIHSVLGPGSPGASLRAGTSAAAALLAAAGGGQRPAGFAAPDIEYILEEVDVEQLLASVNSRGPWPQQQPQGRQGRASNTRSLIHHSFQPSSTQAAQQLLLLDGGGSSYRGGQRTAMQDLALEEAFEAAMNASKQSLMEGCLRQEADAAGGDDAAWAAWDQGPAGGPCELLPGALVGSRGGAAAFSPWSPGPASSQGEDGCGVCLDAGLQVQARGCRHELCLACCRELLRQHCMRPATCPFCRGVIAGFDGLLPGH
jgi:hypothetical protein